MDINFSLDCGKIVAVKIYSDALDYKFIEVLSEKLINIEFKKEVVVQKLCEISSENIITDEIGSWLSNVIILH